MSMALTFYAAERAASAQIAPNHGGMYYHAARGMKRTYTTIYGKHRHTGGSSRKKCEITSILAAPAPVLLWAVLLSLDVV